MIITRPRVPFFFEENAYTGRHSGRMRFENGEPPGSPVGAPAFRQTVASARDCVSPCLTTNVGFCLCACLCVRTRACASDDLVCDTGRHRDVLAHRRSKSLVSVLH